MDLVEKLLKAASESRRASMEESANAVYILLLALQKVGFTREEAFKLVLETFKHANE